MYHIIINPASCSGKGIIIWKKTVEPALHGKNIKYRSYFSERSGDVARLCREITSVHSSARLIILGGDGTVNEALQGIQNLSKTVLSYIPTGSSNDLARDLKISKDPLIALDHILSGSIHRLDLGKVEYGDGSSRRFAVSCGIGFDAAVCEEAMNSRLKDTLNRMGLGKLTYLGIALRQLLAARAVSCEIQLDQGDYVNIHKVLFVTSMIHRYEGGGFMFCPDAQDHDGILDLCAVGDLSKLLILLALPTAFFGKHYIVKGITPYKAREVTIRTSSPLWVHTDGEVVRKADMIHITCEKEALRFLY